MRTALLTSALIASLSAAAPGQTLLGSLPGQPGEQLGTAAVPWRDVDFDGYPEVLVGAPYYGAGGGVMVVSGRYLVTGAGAPVLQAVPGPTSPGIGEFGWTLALVGDWTGDGLDEVVVGAPYYSSVGAGLGAVFLLDGANFDVIGKIQNSQGTGYLGRSLAVVSDLTFDGLPEIAAAAPGTQTVYVLKSQGFFNPNGYTLGESLSSVSGLYADSLAVRPASPTDELFIGCTSCAGGFGAVLRWNVFGSQASIFVQGSTYSEGLGASVAVGDDYDGDGLRELIVGAPWWGPSGKYEGRALVVAGSDGAVLREYQGGLSGPNLNATGWQLGAAVSACEDLNGDGVGDYLVGLPAYATQLPVGPDKGGARVYSGATGDQFVGLTGANNDLLGYALLSVHDYDGDGFPELLIGGFLSDANGTDSGRVNLYRLFPVPARSYCSGKPNSLGCTPAVGWSGSASASAAAPFTATCANVLNNKLGVLFYGFAPAAKPFQGGTKCVAGPIKRLPAQDSGGGPTGSDCSGTFSVELNGLIQSGANPALVAGAEVYCQFWSRDPLSSFGSSLSNGLRFVINP